MAFGGYGVQGMLKDGHKLLSGLDEAVLKNIEACKQLSKITRSSLGPNGMNKMVINHLDKLFVTSDAATIVNELEVAHPAAKLLVLAGKAQQEEIGDGTNLVVTLAGELLQGAEDLIRSGLHPSEILAGYNKACQKVLEYLEALVEPGSDKIDVRNKDDVAKRMTAAVASKQYGQEDILCPLIAEACIQVAPKNPANFNVDNVRVAKIVGGSIYDSHVVQGMVIKRDAEGTIKRAEKAKIAVFGGGLDTSATETKGTVLIESAAQLEGYTKSEEDKMEALIKAIADSGAKVVVSGQAVGEVAMHFCERYKLMVLKILSKFELRRFCRATNSTSLVQVGKPEADELGYADVVEAQEIGGQRVTIVRNETGGNHIATVVVRASTDNIADDIERAIEDGVNAYKAMGKDPRLVAGAGATEIELAKKLREYGRKETGLDQYAIHKFADSLEVVPRTLSENAGLNATDIISGLYAAHARGEHKAGINVDEGTIQDLTTKSVWDLYATKYWAIRLAVDAVVTVLRVDQIIMAKQAGGPKKPEAGGMDED
eukprot:TRINITY_DN15553_c0_g1_i1.p1 TRINITY_DN15553_c0_g1~~TRINITY_DN15553_c0_g1_i1.p1  ORF type:complete len:543 (+),score=192.87 TRINITY_DN15553_c0_g1_i1:208-1836(+)